MMLQQFHKVNAVRINRLLILFVIESAAFTLAHFSSLVSTNQQN